MNVNDDLFNATQVTEDWLICHFTEPPVYVTALKAMIPVGHFVIVDIQKGTRSVVCQIIGCIEGHDHLIKILPFLPLYSSEANEYFGSTTLLPRALTGRACSGVMELFRTSSVGTVRPRNVWNIAFIFLMEQLMNHSIHIHGISNAFVVHFKFSFETQSLSLLDSVSFKCFPGVDIQYQQIWSNCYGHTIYSAIDH